MEQLSYINSQNNNVSFANTGDSNSTGGGLLSILNPVAMFGNNIPFFYLVLCCCCLSSYICSNSKTIFRKTTEEYFVYFLLGVIIAESIALFTAYNNPTSVPPPVQMAIYIIAVIALMVLCFSSYY